MRTLLLGHWDTGGNLVVSASRRIEDDDEATVAELVAGQGNNAWADTFDTDNHRAAIDAAFAQYVHETDIDGNDVSETLIDQTTGLRHR
ncbi:hypothetical protein AB0J01_28265 [Streptomyces sp. NPDC050204]|uniref:hypothetical protein n=1 Tax=Streptomyces sp. NPDC050204 TaxID=3155514 RepID=UPI00344307C8